MTAARRSKGSAAMLSLRLTSPHIPSLPPSLPLLTSCPVLSCSAVLQVSCVLSPAVAVRGRTARSDGVDLARGLPGGGCERQHDAVGPQTLQTSRRVRVQGPNHRCSVRCCITWRVVCTVGFGIQYSGQLVAVCAQQCGALPAAAAGESPRIPTSSIASMAHPASCSRQVAALVHVPVTVFGRDHQVQCAAPSRSFRTTGLTLPYIHCSSTTRVSRRRRSASLCRRAGQATFRSF